MAKVPLKTHQMALLGAAGASVVLAAMPIAQLLLLPLMYLNTHIHEIWHALAAHFTGGTAQYIMVFSNGSGVTPVATQGPLGLLITASAGYVGSALTGAGLILWARRPETAKIALKVLSIVLACAMILWVRGDSVGIMSGIFWVVALWALGTWTRGDGAVFAGQFVGIQQCLNAAQSILVLLHLSVATETQSDAMILQIETGIPAIVWALSWTLFSALLLTVAVRRSWSTSAG